VVEHPDSEFRICIPEQWAETVREILCGDASKI